MEKIIGILEEESEYPRRLARYINDRHDIGCAAVAFKNEGELLLYSRKNKLSALLVGNGQEWNEEKVQEYSSCLAPDGALWQLSEERSEEDAALLYGVLGVYRYQKADAVVKRILGGITVPEGIQGGLYTVYSPSSNVAAEEFAWSLAKELRQYGRTLFLSWEPFGGFGRREGETPVKTLSELLYVQSGHTEAGKELLSSLPEREGVEYIPSVDYYADLWQYSAVELPLLMETCKAAGCRNIVFLDRDFLGGNRGGNAAERSGIFSDRYRKRRRMPEAGIFPADEVCREAAMLSQVKEVYGTDGREALRQLKKEQEVQWKK